MIVSIALYKLLLLGIVFSKLVPFFKNLPGLMCRRFLNVMPLISFARTINHVSNSGGNMKQDFRLNLCRTANGAFSMNLPWMCCCSMVQSGKKALVPEADFPNFGRRSWLHLKSSLEIRTSPRLLLLRELAFVRYGSCHIDLVEPCTGEADSRTFFFTQKKLLRRLKEAWLVPMNLYQVFAFDLPHLVDLTLQAITEELKLMKQTAIRKWRDAMKNATTSLAIGKVVYQYLKRKGRVLPQNLVEDDDGNIVYDPQTAMDTIAEKWDTVFSVNASHQHEMQILKQVWPYIHDKGHSIVLGPITESQLWEQAARRKPDAAAGLDGWNTREVQALPPVAFRPVAALFNAIEAGSADFPTILTQVRMIILNKDGSDAPLSKRLISLQSIFTLLYTGLRFLQLQIWQQQVMPPQLKGGIKARQMSEVHMTLQLEIDHAHSFQGSFAALKLDKSKCFDRLMPKLCAAIMLALGLPATLVRGFLGLYTRMTRFLSFKQWTRERAISMPNGVVQGCSVSLLCINIHIAIWAWIMCKIDGVAFRAFIDDTYLWTRQSTIDGLVAAVRATELWDSLCGQFLNTSKCEIFATSSSLRKALKQAFPQSGQHIGGLCPNYEEECGQFPGCQASECPQRL